MKVGYLGFNKNFVSQQFDLILFAYMLKMVVVVIS
jgi:hypothetical protein